MHGAGANVLAPGVSLVIRGVLRNLERGCKTLTRAKRTKHIFRYRAMNIKKWFRGAKKVEVRNKEGCEKRRVRCTPFFINGGACCLCTPPHEYAVVGK